MVPVIFGVGIVQVNVLVDTQFASYLQEGSVTAIYYADRVMELVLGGDNECDNMTPCNASVNRSCGSQIGHTLRDPVNAGGSISKIQPAKKCTPPGGDTKPCTQNWSANAKLA